MKNGEHLKQEGIIKIIDISAQMNREEKVKALQIRKQLQTDKDKVHTC